MFDVTKLDAWMPWYKYILLIAVIVQCCILEYAVSYSTPRSSSVNLYKSELTIHSNHGLGLEMSALKSLQWPKHI